MVGGPLTCNTNHLLFSILLKEKKKSVFNGTGVFYLKENRKKEAGGFCSSSLSRLRADSTRIREGGKGS